MNSLRYAELCQSRNIEAFVNIPWSISKQRPRHVYYTYAAVFKKSLVLRLGWLNLIRQVQFKTGLSVAGYVRSVSQNPRSSCILSTHKYYLYTYRQSLASVFTIIHHEGRLMSSGGVRLSSLCVACSPQTTVYAKKRSICTPVKRFWLKLHLELSEMLLVL